MFSDSFAISFAKTDLAKPFFEKANEKAPVPANKSIIFNMII